jgi:hypothetical protein
MIYSALLPLLQSTLGRIVAVVRDELGRKYAEPIMKYLEILI